MLKGGISIDKKTFNNIFTTNLNISVLIASVISVIFGVIASYIPSDSKISVKIFAIYACITLFIIWLLLIKIFTPKIDVNDLSLNVIKFFNEPCNPISCIMKPCEYVSIGSYVTFFYLDNGIEIYFATGIINNIQNNNLIKVDICSEIIKEDLMSKISNNNSEFIKSIIVKPIITNNFLKEDF